MTRQHSTDPVLCSLRPADDDAWVAGPTATAMRERILDSSGDEGRDLTYGDRSARRRPGPLALAAGAAAVLAVAVGLALLRSPDPGPPAAGPVTVVTMPSGGGFAFDPDDLEVVVRNADAVVLVDVVAEEGASVEDQRTTFAVTVVDTVKGDLTGRVPVSQLGYREGNVVHAPAGQPRLEPGKRYVLAVTTAGRVLVLPGPHGARGVDGTGQRELDAYRQALR